MPSLEMNRSLYCKTFAVSPMPYYGGKSRVVDITNSIINRSEASHVYDLCCGSGVMLLSSQEHKYELLNDLNPDVYNLFSMIKYKPEEMLAAIRMIRYGENFFKRAKEVIEKPYNIGGVSRAILFLATITESYNAAGKNFSLKNNANNFKYDKYFGFKFNNSLVERVKNVIQRIQNVKISNNNCLDILKTTIPDNEDYLLLLDVPYTSKVRGKGATHVYKCEMTDSVQLELLNIIKGFKRTKIVLFGYACCDYDNVLLANGYRRYLLAQLPKTSQSTHKKDIGLEQIWVNFDLDFLSDKIDISQPITLKELAAEDKKQYYGYYEPLKRGVQQ